MKKAFLLVIGALLSVLTLLYLLGGLHDDSLVGPGELPRDVASTAQGNQVPIPTIPSVRERLADQPEILVHGQVLLRRPDDQTEGVAATLRWGISKGSEPSERELEQAEEVNCATDGAFVLKPKELGMLFCVAEHADGMTTVVRCDLPTEFLTIEMPAAGKLDLRLPGNQLPFQLLLTPVTTTERAAGVRLRRRRRLMARGTGESLRYGGIPLEWGSVKIAILWANGGRMDVDGAVPLKFREWSFVTVEGLDRPAVVLGKVLDESGIAVTDAWVSLGKKLRESDSSPESWSMGSTSNGSFRFDHLPAGEMTLSVSKSGFVSYYQPLTLGFGKVLDLGALVLNAGAVLRGKVELEPEDRRSAQVSLTEVRELTDFSMPFQKRAKVARDGQFAFSGVAAGQWIVAAFDGKPEILQTPFSGRLVSVGETDRDVLVPELQLPVKIPWSMNLSFSTGQPLGAIRAIARGIDRPWATFGKVDSDGLVEMSIQEGRFLFGLSLDRGLRWFGVLTKYDHYLQIPTGSVILVSDSDPQSAVTTTASIVYRRIDGWPSDVLPLVGNFLKIEADRRQYKFPHLFPGSYEIRISSRRKVSSVFAELPPGARTVRVLLPK